MKDFKIKLKHDFAEALLEMIALHVNVMVAPDDDERLFIAGIREVELKLKKKMIEYMPKFQMTLSPVQALALRMFYTDCVGINATYASNKLRMIADEIHQHYS